jgi:zinc/manganese transport system substrate-binding protein
MRRALAFAVAVLAGAAIVTGCGKGSAAKPLSAADRDPTIVVTYSVLGSLVEELVGDEADVTVLMPGGVDPHEWQPSAKDVEALGSADLVVVNGLHLEESLAGALDGIGAPVFTATDHVDLRTLGTGDDPHIWTDPLAMKAVVVALANDLEATLGLDIRTRAAVLEERLVALDVELRDTLAAVPSDERKLVTGHESLGYFADRYGFELVGAVVPSSSSQAEASAGELAELKELIEREDVSVVFTEIGAPSRAAEAIAAEAGATVVELPSHTLPGDGSYFTFIRNLAAAVASASSS